MLTHPTTLKHQKQKTALRERLGGKCCRCGFSDWRALQFDHIKGGTGRNRASGYTYYKQLVKACDAGELQLLCANCNWIKRYENTIEMGGPPPAKLAMLRDIVNDWVQTLQENSFSVPVKDFGDRRTVNTLTPAIYKMLRILGEPIRVIDAAIILIAFGWQFGNGKHESYNLGAMTIRTAMRRRTDIFGLENGYIYLTGIELQSYTCVHCAHEWFPREQEVPRLCAKCKKSWFGAHCGLTGERRTQLLERQLEVNRL